MVDHIIRGDFDILNNGISHSLGLRISRQNAFIDGAMVFPINFYCLPLGGLKPIRASLGL